VQKRACEQHIKHLVMQIWLDMVMFYGAVELAEVREINHMIGSVPITTEQLCDLEIVAAGISNVQALKNLHTADL
jgi:hypothetical protein